AREPAGRQRLQPDAEICDGEVSCDHLGVACEQRRRHFEAERFGGLEIDHQLEFARQAVSGRQSDDQFALGGGKSCWRPNWFADRSQPMQWRDDITLLSVRSVITLCSGAPPPASGFPGSIVNDYSDG